MSCVYPSPPSRVRAADVCVGVRFPSNPVFRLRLNRAVWLVIRTVVVTEEKLLNANVLDGMMLAGSDSLNTIQRVRDTPRGEECAAIISTSAASGHLAQLRTCQEAEILYALLAPLNGPNPTDLLSPEK